MDECAGPALTACMLDARSCDHTYEIHTREGVVAAPIHMVCYYSMANPVAEAVTHYPRTYNQRALSIPQTDNLNIQLTADLLSFWNYIGLTHEQIGYN